MLRRATTHYVMDVLHKIQDRSLYFPDYKINHSKKYVSDLFRLASSSLLLRAQIKINISSHGVVSTSLSLCIKINKKQPQPTAELSCQQLQKCSSSPIKVTHRPLKQQHACGHHPQASKLRGWSWGCAGELLSFADPVG